MCWWENGTLSVLGVYSGFDTAQTNQKIAIQEFRNSGKLPGVEFYY